ncbi:protein NDRG3-like isoform X3 [Acanthaster planci]|uniref:Protein NDRG3-like isoform X3 n=1 Tax=Acanthaster planci TaxID=133434 RepID=A0A8B7XSW0_ACAPL|nr:protein NDRG3-like isoform X3 [Acanthaster planci]
MSSPRHKVGATSSIQYKMSYHKLAGSEPEEGEVNLTHVQAEVPQDTYQRLDSDQPAVPAAMELFKVEVTDAKARNFDGFEDTNKSPLLKEDGEKTVPYELVYVPDDNGIMLVAVQGDKTKPAIITYHDIGLNHVTCFQGFFNFPDMTPILKQCCVYHVNAPGQEQGAHQLPEGKPYPDMDTLGEMLMSVVKHFGLKKFIGFGVGAGANILARFELAHPQLVEGLVLVNCTSKPATWGEWGQQKLSSFYLRGKGMTSYSQEYLLWHYFGKKTMESNHDLVTVFRENLAKSVNPYNLSLFIDSYIRRTDLKIKRELDPVKKKATRTLKGAIMLIGGSNSPHLNDTVEMNARLDPENSTWIKMSDCGGMILEEQPAKLCESFRLFLQGLGYADVLKIRATRPAQSAESSDLHVTSKSKGAPSPVFV